MALNVRPVDPLRHDVPIVDEQGRPTPQFIRQWLAARQINLTTDDLTISVDELRSLIEQAQALLATLEGRQIIAGVGLTGGGDLSAGRTLNLSDTAVVPGAYGGAGQHMAISVDQQGRITSIANA